MADKEFSDIYAYDAAKGIRQEGEAINEEAINVSIENILMTNYGERVFLPDFGSPLPFTVFETLNETNGEILLNQLIDAIKTWENRITLLEEQIRLDVRPDLNTMIIILPYRINRNGLTGTFSRKIIL